VHLETGNNPSNRNWITNLPGGRGWGEQTTSHPRNGTTKNHKERTLGKIKGARLCQRGEENTDQSAELSKTFPLYPTKGYMGEKSTEGEGTSGLPTSSAKAELD